ncbi:MAG: hypothetical protein KKB50_00840 [Planctomycetes bacterium]|nr:hypothetical protein [Planctomycetota bacterium]
MTVLRSRLHRVSLVVIAAGLVWAERPAPLPLDQATRVPPRALASIDADLHLTGPWQTVGDGGIAQDCWSTLVFDCFHGDMYYFGPDYRAPGAINDMSFDSLYGGQKWCACEYAWCWYVEGAGTSENCYVMLACADEFDDTCQGPPASGYHAGVIFWYGDLPSNPGYYWSFPDVCNLGGVDLPSDPDGAYEIIFANGYDANYIYLATGAQPMLSYTAPERPGWQGPIQWDHDGDEWTCNDYSSFDPPLGAAVAFYLYGEDPCNDYICGDCNCDGTLDGFDIDYFVEALNMSPAQWDNTYPDCERICVADTDGDQSVNGFDIDGFIQALNTGTCPRDE